MRPKVARCTGAWTIGVAPRAGAWIETFKKWLSKASLSIAPLAGASIETIPPCDWQNAISKSPLVQGRGLKLPKPRPVSAWYQVAPRAGAWIETTTTLSPW